MLSVIASKRDCRLIHRKFHVGMKEVMQLQRASVVHANAALLTPI